MSKKNNDWEDAEIYSENIFEDEEDLDENFDDTDGFAVLLPSPKSVNTVKLEFTFKVKEEYKEIFIRIAKAVKKVEQVGGVAFGSVSEPIMNALVNSINLDTKCINKKEFKENTNYWLSIAKSTKKVAVKSLKSGMNVFEKKAPVISYFSRMSEIPTKQHQNIYNCIDVKTWSTLSSVYNGVKIKNIYVKDSLQEEVYCTAVFEFYEYHTFSDAVAGTIGTFIGTFGDKIKEFVWQSGKDFNSKSEKCSVQQYDNSFEIIDFKEAYLKATKDLKKKFAFEKDLPKKLVVKRVDLKKVYQVNMQVTLSSEAEELIKTINKPMEVFEAAGIYSKQDRITEIIQILSMKKLSLKDNYLNRKSDMGINLVKLRNYEQQEILEKLSPEMRKYFEDNFINPKFTFNPNRLNELTILGRMTNLKKENFTEDKEKGVMKWNFEAEFTGLSLEDLEGINLKIKEAQPLVILEIKEKETSRE